MVDMFNKIVPWVKKNFWSKKDNIFMGQDTYIATDTVRARDSGGLSLTDKDGLGLSIADGGNTTLSNGKFIAADEIRARDSGGLFLKDDSGTMGIFVEDGGKVGFGSQTNPVHFCDLEASQSGSVYYRVKNTSSSGTATSGLLVESTGGALYARAFPGTSSLVADWSDSGVINVDSVMDGGLVLSSVDKVRIQTTVGTDAFLVQGGVISIIDGQTAPTATSGRAKIFVDSADGDLKVIFGDGTTKTIVTDT